MPRPKTGGRQTGTPNKATAEFKETVRQLLEDNRQNVSKWLTLVAEGNHSQVAEAIKEGKEPPKEIHPDPGKALDLITKVAEYAYPKLARTELTGKDGGTPEFIVTWQSRS